MKNEIAGFDVSAFDFKPGSEEGAEVQILNPVLSTPTPLFVTIYGPESSKARAAQREMITESQRSFMASDEEIDARAARAVAAVTKGWRGMMWEGKELPFTTENAVMVYTQRPWLREQVERFQGTRANFFKK